MVNCFDVIALRHDPAQATVGPTPINPQIGRDFRVQRADRLGGGEWGSNPPGTGSLPQPDLKSGRPTGDDSLLGLDFITLSPEASEFIAGVRYRFATLAFARVPYRTPDHLVNLRGGICLHTRHHMRIKIERNTDCRVSGSLASNLGTDACRKQLGRMCVAQIVESFVREVQSFEEAQPAIGQLSRLERLPLKVIHDEGVVVASNP